jgi:hypothetical protein
LRFLPLAFSSLGIGPRRCTANCCCYCGGGLGGGFGGSHVIEGNFADFQAALRVAEQQAQEQAIPQGRAQVAAYMVYTL